MEYQPEDTQISREGYTYVPSLNVLLGARGRYNRFFSMKTERKQNKRPMTSHRLPALSYLPN